MPSHRTDAAIRTSNNKPDLDAPLTGRTICDDTIVLGRLLGHGGFGQVYRAEQVRTGRALAVKVVNRPSEKQASFRVHLQREIETQRLMSDDVNVPSLHLVTEDAEYVYLVMDFCDMSTMTNFVNTYRAHEREPACFEVKQNIMLQLIDTIQRCHDRQIFHRDIKPENVLVDLDGEHVYIIDFGLAVVEPISRNCRTGTKEYMSPECFSEFNFTGRGGTPFSSAANDVWSLGVVFFYLMVGRKLWAQPTFADGRFAEFVTDSKSYFYNRYGVSLEAQRILGSVLTVDPNERMDLRTFRDQVATLGTFFRPREDFASHSQKLFTRSPIITRSDMNIAGVAYRATWMSRSKELCEAGNLVLSNDNHVLRPAHGRPSQLKDVYAYADALKASRLAQSDAESDMLHAPSLVSRLTSIPSFDSSLLHTPPAARPLSLAEVDVAAVSSGALPRSPLQSGRIASDSPRPAAAYRQLQLADMAIAHAKSSVALVPQVSKGKRRAFLAGVSSVLGFGVKHHPV